MKKVKKKLNENLQLAKKTKNDEFYTRYIDIANELDNYKEFLKNKRIIAPCDWDANERTIENEENINLDSCNFSKFLNAQFENYSIKSLTFSGYNPQTGLGKKFQDVDYNDYDLVITNPPFSQFGEFIDKLTSYSNLNFLVIGPKNALAYKNIADKIVNNQLWMGYNSPKIFIQPDGSEKKFGNIGWFTNLDVKYRNDKKVLFQEYDSTLHPFYDGWENEIIDVQNVKLIPYNWDGLMGVPISFVEKFNPKQFKLHGIISNYKFKGKKILYVNGKKRYARAIVEVRK